MKQAVIILVSILVGGLAAFLAVGRTPAPSGAHAPVEAEHEEPAAPIPVKTAAASLGTLDETIEFSGSLKTPPEGQARLAPQIAGRLARLSVRPGQRVTAGQVIAVVEHADLTAEIARARAAVAEGGRETEALGLDLRAQSEAADTGIRTAQAGVEAAQARLDRLRAGNRAEEIAKAASSLEATEADLARLRAGARPQEIAQAAAAVREGSAEVEARQRDAQRKSALFERGIVAAKEKERAAADLTQSQARLDSAQQNEALVRAGPRPEEIRAAEARVREARAGLDLLKQGTRSEDLREGEAALREARAKLSEAQAVKLQLGGTRVRALAAKQREAQARQALVTAAVQQDRSTLRAPFSGVVTEVLAAVGEQVSSQTPIATIVNPRVLRAVVQVPAVYRSAVFTGAPMQLSLLDDPASRVPTIVHHVSPGALPGTDAFTAELWLAAPPPAWKDGLLVRAVLHRAGGGGRVMIPISAVFDRAGERYVYVVAEGAAHERRVDISGEDSRRAAISVGLKPGERVIIDGSLSLADESPVTEAR